MPFATKRKKKKEKEKEASNDQILYKMWVGDRTECDQLGLIFIKPCSWGCWVMKQWMKIGID